MQKNLSLQFEVMEAVAAPAVDAADVAIGIAIGIGIGIALT